MLQGSVNASNKYIPVNIYGRPNLTDTMLSYFNSKFNTKAIYFPENSYSIIKNTSNIKVAGTLGSDSLQLKIIDYTKYNYNQQYILPIEVYVPSLDTSAATPDTSMARVAFISYTVNHLESGNIDSINPIITGTLIDKKVWTAWASDNANYTTNPPANAIDGSNTTYWASTLSTPLNYNVNMGQYNIVKGFRFTPQYATIARDFIRMIVYSSTDSITWNQEGYYFGTATKATTSATNPDYKYIKFIKPVTAKYFRFYINKSSYTYGQTSIAEIDAYYN